MTHAWHLLDVDILQRAAEVAGLLHARAGAIGDIEVDVAPDPTGEARMEDRVEPDCKLDRDALLIEPTTMSGRYVAPEECPTRMIVLMRPLL